MDKTTEACKIYDGFVKYSDQIRRENQIKIDTLQQTYDLIMAEVKYFGTNNCKAITEDKLNFIFRGLGLNV